MRVAAFGQVFDSGLIGEGVLHLLAWAHARLLTPDCTLVSSQWEPCCAFAQQHFQKLTVGTLLCICPATFSDTRRIAVAIKSDKVLEQLGTDSIPVGAMKGLVLGFCTGSHGCHSVLPANPDAHGACAWV